MPKTAQRRDSNGTGHEASTAAGLLDQLATQEGTHPTPVPGVRLTRRSALQPRHQAIYEPLIIFIGQGRKHVYLGDEVLRYDADHYLALSVPVPVECEVIQASAAEPLLALSIVVDSAMLAEILVSLDEPLHADGAVPRGIYASQTPPPLRSAVIRLLETLRDPSDSRILGKQIVREIVYRVLQDEPGGTLRALATRNDQFMRIARVIQQIHANYAQPLNIDDMARKAGMSVSAFHHNFKAVTTTSPLQYLKHIRLHRARLMMVHAGHNASSAAAAVGYESPSQFGREFKRMFGASPTEEADAIRERLAAGIFEARDKWVPEMMPA